MPGVSEPGHEVCDGYPHDPLAPTLTTELKVELEWTRCNHCKNAFFTPTQSKQADLRIARARAAWIHQN